MAVAFRAGANNKANSTAPSVVVPAGCQTGDVIVVHISQNNTNVITAAPAGLTAQNTNTTTAAFPNVLYTGVVGTGGITAGGTLSWTLSATRQWSVTLYAASGVDTSTPILGTIQTVANATAASTAATPSLTTTGSGWILELLSGKSNGTAITGWTAPTGWTVEQSCTAAGTFAGGTSIADRNAGIAAAGTYGGDTYTASSGFAGLVAYTFALNPIANTAVTLTETGTGADALSASATTTVTETGTGTDALAASASLTQSDTGTLTDALAVSQPVSLPDTGHGTDALSTPSVTATTAETGTGADALSTSVTLAQADTGSFTDSMLVSSPVGLADTATGTDALTVTVTVPLPETGHGTDGLSDSATLPLSDTGSGSDGLTVLTGNNPSLPDTAHGTDNLTITIQVSLSDTGSLLDSLSVVTPAVSKYLYTPPQWRNAQGPPFGQMRYGFPTSTCVYRTGGVWHNTLVSGPDDPYKTADTDPVSGQKLFFVTPTVISGVLHDEMAAQALTPSDPKWTPGTLTLVP
jgi:hypothetical protein